MYLVSCYVVLQELGNAPYTVLCGDTGIGNVAYIMLSVMQE